MSCVQRLGALNQAEYSILRQHEDNSFSSLTMSPQLSGLKVLGFEDYGDREFIMVTEVYQLSMSYAQHVPGERGKEAEKAHAARLFDLLHAALAR